MATRCRITGGTARYEVYDWRPDEGFQWEPRVARFARKAAENGKRVRPSDRLTAEHPPDWTTDPPPSSKTRGDF